MAMEGVVRLHKSWYKIRRPLAVAAASLLWIAPSVVSGSALTWMVVSLRPGGWMPAGIQSHPERHDCICSSSQIERKVVLVAVMRKIITILNAMLRDNVPWVDRSIGRHILPAA
jgi:hypothetical protein